MTMKITMDMIESYILCKNKAYLKLIKRQGHKSNYELFFSELRENVRTCAIEQIRQHHQDVGLNLSLNTAVLRKGKSFLLDSLFEDDKVSLVFAGLKLIDGPSRLGTFHYIPILFSEYHQVRKPQRIILDLCAFYLTKLQGKSPTIGVVWHGKECRNKRVRLTHDYREIARQMESVQRMVNESLSPKLILNNHCQICEFSQFCHDQALNEDTLSLLRGLKEKEVTRYARKGILTVTQLAHTFRPRRSGKRVPPRNNHHYYALQALAIRDKRVYIFGAPKLLDAPVCIYLDIEGNPDQGFNYLIGMTICKGGENEHFSFWADNKTEECLIFEKFLATVNSYEDFVVFSYGGYERTFLKRMRKQAKRKLPVDRVLKALVNTLSLIYAHIYFPTYSNGLKDIGSFLGFSWTDRDASGIQSIIWRSIWEDTGDEKWKKKLIVYNMEDCAALKIVTEFVYSVGSKPVLEAISLPNSLNPETVLSVEEIDRLGTVNKRGLP